MLFNRYVFALVLASGVSALSLFLVLSRIDPFTDETLGLILFFISLFFTVSSILSLVGYGIRMVFYRDELMMNHFNISLRQGVVLGVCICAVMGLQVMRTLTWWTGVIVILLSFLIEIYFVARE